MAFEGVRSKENCPTGKLAMTMQKSITVLRLAKMIIKSKNTPVTALIKRKRPND